MNANLARLAWKEYRFARAFWISIVGLVVAAQALIAWWFRIEQFTDARIAMWVCNLALGAPVFFALGCAGASFAVEREEGTYDFLRAAPISAAQVLATKLGLTAVATLAMFALLWPVAMAFTRGHFPDASVLPGMLGLWLMAAVEAIAWGTLFSLLSARPLVAVCLALAAASTVTHLFAWSMSEGPGYEFQFAHYQQALVWRVLVVAALLAADVYLGLRWLDENEPIARPAKRKRAVTNRAVAKLPAIEFDRSTIVGRLFWQHFRQSGRLMLLLAGLQIFLVLLTLYSGLDVDRREPMQPLPIFPLVFMAATMGTCVFLADQERHHFRFFVEHNVPPRYVWFSRQLSWLAVLVASSLLSCILWIGPGRLVHMVGILFVDPYNSPRWHDADMMLAFALAMCLAILVYAAGQWTSMMVRSGLLAGVLGILLAALLCGWLALMTFLQISWLWSVAPIPLVLLWATWLRAPDWVRENTTWRARGKAATAVLVPALTLCAVVPYYRVHQVPLVSPGFDVANYEARIQDSGLKTAALYRAANELFEREEDRNVWLKKNAEPLAILLEAARQPHCLLNDPRKADTSPNLWNAQGLVRLLIASGRQLEDEGKLDEALDRYFTTLRIISQWTENNAASFSEATNPDRSPAVQMSWVLDAIAKWASAEGQTVERIREAIERVGKLDIELLHSDERLKAAYLVARRFIEGDWAAGETLFGDPSLHSAILEMFLYKRLLPWEKYRELRDFDGYTADALARLAAIERHLAAGAGVVHEVPSEQPHYYYYFPVRTLLQIAPVMHYFESMAAFELAAFENWRRATMLLLALQAFRLEKGELPPSLDALVGTYLDKLPRDPYSGHDYVYFREGLPQPATDLEAAQLAEAQQTQVIEPGVPCLWGTSSMLETMIWRPEREDPTTPPPDKPFVTHQRRFHPGGSVNEYETWALGYWFPIPAMGE